MILHKVSAYLHPITYGSSDYGGLLWLCDQLARACRERVFTALPQLTTATTTLLKQAAIAPALIKELYFPLSTAVHNAYHQREQRLTKNNKTTLSYRYPMLVGISGGQGAGKSTVAALLGYLLQVGLGYRVGVVSLDDFYLSQAERLNLARLHSPLFQTRGVPGTHDISWLKKVIVQLLAPYAEALGAEKNNYSAQTAPTALALPRFSKADDNRTKVAYQLTVPIDIILLEGWCIGIPPQAEAALRTPCNGLEANEDKKGIWRRTVNNYLKKDYAAIFALIDYLIYLQVPDFKTVFSYRWQQEQQLPASKQMKKEALEHFIAHYQRLTEHGLAILPRLAAAVVRLTPERTINELVFQSPQHPRNVRRRFK